MRKALIVVVVAAAAIVSALGDRAVAMTPPILPAAPPAAMSFVVPVTNVCGTNGCVRVQTSPPRKRRPPNHRP
jgi:hypothetical protein